MKDIIIVASDSRYFPFAQECIASIRASPGLDQPIGMLDLGLDDTQRNWLARAGVEARIVGWDLDFPTRDQWEQAMPGFKAMVSRPFLRDHFSGYRVYMWIDVDAWIQDQAAIRDMIAAVQSGGCALVPEVSRSYFTAGTSPEVLKVRINRIARCLGDDLALKIAGKPVLNSGVFALHNQAPHWDHWTSHLKDGLMRITEVSDITRMVEMFALNAAVYLHGLPIYRFPSQYNWIAYLAHPAWDIDRERFVEPDPPYDPIAVLHLTRHLLTTDVDIVCVGAGLGPVSVKTALRYRQVPVLIKAKERLRQAAARLHG